MSANTMTLFATARPALRAMIAHVRLGDAIKTLRAAWHEANRAAASRRNLHGMDDRMLSDIGVSRAQAAFEASRWG